MVGHRVTWELMIVIMSEMSKMEMVPKRMRSNCITTMGMKVLVRTAVTNIHINNMTTTTMVLILMHQVILARAVIGLVTPEVGVQVLQWIEKRESHLFLRITNQILHISIYFHYYFVLYELYCE